MDDNYFQLAEREPAARDVMVEEKPCSGWEE